MNDNNSMIVMMIATTILNIHTLTIPIILAVITFLSFLPLNADNNH